MAVKLDHAGLVDNFWLALVQEVKRKDWRDNRDVSDKFLAVMDTADYGLIVANAVN